jgi:hypothetical protein
VQGSGVGKGAGPLSTTDPNLSRNHPRPSSTGRAITVLIAYFQDADDAVSVARRKGETKVIQTTTA